MPDLTDGQAAALEVLSGGGSRADAARAGGVSPKTVDRWKAKFGWDFTSVRGRAAVIETRAATAATVQRWVDRRGPEADRAGQLVGETRDTLLGMVVQIRDAHAGDDLELRAMAPGPGMVTALVGVWRAAVETAEQLTSDMGAKSESLLDEAAAQLLEEKLRSDLGNGIVDKWIAEFEGHWQGPGNVGPDGRAADFEGPLHGADEQNRGA